MQWNVSINVLLANQISLCGISLNGCVLFAFIDFFFYLDSFLIRFGSFLIYSFFFVSFIYILVVVYFEWLQKRYFPKYRCEWTTDSIVTYDWTIWRLELCISKKLRAFRLLSLTLYLYINVFVIDWNYVCVCMCRFSTYRSFIDLLFVFSQ